MGRRTSAEDDVHVGEDGWLFLVGGRNRPLTIHQRSLLGAWRLRRWAALLRARRRRCDALGIRYLHLVVPDKLSVYGDKAPRLGLDGAHGTGRRLAVRLGREGIVIEIDAAMRAARGAAETFLQTDSHWTVEGCKIAHDAVCAATSAPFRWRLLERPATEVRIVGDLGGKLDPPRGETEIRRDIARDSRRIEANGLVERFEAAGLALDLHRGTRVAFRNEAPDADPRTLLIFGDSFAHFLPVGLTGMLAETFREVHFVWSAAVDWALVGRIGPDILLTEIAERFMAYLPSDGFDSERFAAERLARLAAT